MGLIRINRLKINRLVLLILRNFTEFFYLLLVSKTTKLHTINPINRINQLIFSRLILINPVNEIRTCQRFSWDWLIDRSPN